VNTAAATTLYQLAGDWAACGGRTLLFDVCCGTGTIGLTLASRVGKVVGVDIVETAIKDAAANAARLGVTNAEFVCGKAEVVLPGLLRAYDAKVGAAADEGEGEKSEERFENIVAIVDPPRAGLHKHVLSALRAAKGLRRLVYVSCNPESLAENAVVLCAPVDSRSPHAPRPFHPVKAMAVDLFPHTKHCEAVMLFERAGPEEESGGGGKEKEQELGYIPQE
jgi:tRNA/tmRNA/rRNA uracil-C5-methylase (TrmA/RlmC/RlmD family)